METEAFHAETYTAEISVAGPCACGDSACWKGDAAELDPIEDCALDPGDPSPAGRCPDCGDLAYPVKPEPVTPARAQAGDADALAQALKLLAALLPAVDVSLDEFTPEPWDEDADRETYAATVQARDDARTLLAARGVL